MVMIEGSPPPRSWSTRQSRGLGRGQTPEATGPRSPTWKILLLFIVCVSYAFVAGKFSQITSNLALDGDQAPSQVEEGRHPLRDPIPNANDGARAHGGPTSADGAPPGHTRTATSRSLSLGSAVTAMRCLTTPGCFPSIKCSSGKKPQNVALTAEWEQHSFCTGDLPSASSERCLVYSFGLHQSSEWEEKMADLFGCDVYAFDPTSDFPRKIAPRVTFHKLGLQGAGTNVSATHSTQYAAIDPSKLRTLGEIVGMLGHEGRSIDVLKMDCEGCEYGVLKELACNGESHLVKQLMVEFHFQKSLGLSNDADVLVAGDAVGCLEEERWGIVSMEKSGCSPLDADYTDSAYKFIRDDFILLFMTLRRIPDVEKLSWERYRDNIEAEVRVSRFAHRYGHNESAMPEHIKKETVSRRKRREKAFAKYKDLVLDRSAGYDASFETIPGQKKSKP
ncbi:hypothetical protein ACHAWF_004547 [Thalassiosira exigua]